MDSNQTVLSLNVLGASQKDILARCGHFGRWQSSRWVTPGTPARVDVGSISRLPGDIFSDRRNLVVVEMSKSSRQDYDQ
jgi:hypothetical protein